MALPHPTAIHNGPNFDSNEISGGSTQNFSGPTHFGAVDRLTQLQVTTYSPEHQWKREFRTTDYFAWQNEVDDPYEGTCQWLDGCREYQEWRNGTKNLLSVVGGPGTGKTVLAKHLVKTFESNNQTESQEEAREAANVIYFFCSPRRKDTRDGRKQPAAITILRTLIHQYLILAPSSDPHSATQRIKDLYDNSPDMLDSLTQLSIVFRELTRNPGPGNWYCIIDGFNSVCNDEKQREILLRCFTADSGGYGGGACPKRIKILITTRPCEEIAWNVKGSQSANIVCFADANGFPLNESDIERYVKGKVSELSEYSSEDREELQTQLLNKAAGNFAWTSSVLTELSRKNPPHWQKTVKATALPSMADMLESTIEALSVKRDSLLGFIIVAMRPLTLAELVTAIKVEEGPFSGLCLGSRTEEAMREYFRLCEPAVRLQNAEIHPFQFTMVDAMKARWDPDAVPDLHLQMAVACLAYLASALHGRGPLEGSTRQACAQEYENLMVELPFLDYASNAWHYHLSHTHHESTSSLWDCIKRSLFEDARRELIFQVHRFSHDKEYVRGQSLFHLLVYHDLTFMVEHILKKKLYASESLSFNARDKKGRTPLWVAVDYMREAMVRLLLNTEGVDCNIADHEGGLTPVMVAVKQGSVTIMDHFVEAGSANITWNARDKKGRTALWLAALHGRDGVAKLLLRKITNIPIELEFKCQGQTALVIAARKGHAQMVKVLLDSGASVNSRDDTDRRTALSWAAGNGHEEAVVYLLEQENVQLDQKDKLDQTPLDWAAAQRHEAIARLILAAMRVRSGNRWPDEVNKMFSEAARRGQTRLFRILSEYPEYPEITPERHHQALFLASKNGHGGIVQRILEASLVSVNSRDAESKTPLICAAEHGRKEVMLLLLGQDGIDLDATDSQKRWNAEEWARHSGHPGLITLLQERRQRAV